MDQNTAAINALREYAKIKEPRYAFMIEAPWGAGKTYLVKHEFQKDLSDGNALYVTLNGVSDRNAFRRALLSNNSGEKLTDAAGKIGNAVGNLAKLGNVGSLIQDVVENKMIENLPDLLIFDDVERCEMSPGELLGLVNEFVEHQKKNVVLCAFIENEGKNGQKHKCNDFLTRKEKVVGRTVRIVADTHNALPEFISAMPDGHGKKWLNSNKDLVLEVFKAETHNNLRVLRQCLYDCGWVIDALEDDLRKSTEAMKRFVRTYLVLSMAIATGEITPKDLQDRSNYKCVIKPDEKNEPHPLFECSERHPHAEIFAGSAASILPVDLGFSLIGIGYEEQDTINQTLRETKQFTGGKDVPLWQRFVKWREIPGKELAKTYEEARSYIFENEDIEPGPYLHIANDVLYIDKDGFGNESETAEKIKKRIKALAKNNNIPAAAYGKDYGWNERNGTFFLGGYGFKPNEIIRPIIDAMRKAQIEAFKKSLDKEAKTLLNLFSTDLEAFGREISKYYGGYENNNPEILQEIDADKFAQAIFDHLKLGREQDVGTQLKALADQHLPRNMPRVATWADKVKTKLIALANDTGPFEKARMTWFLGLYWNFPSADKSEF